MQICRSFFTRKAHEHLPGRPIGEEHSGVALGSARSLRTPINLAERGAGQQRVGGAKDIIEQ